jgi:predicted nucleic acid-binding protein
VQQLVKTAPQEVVNGGRKQLLAFLDTGVIIDYLRGDRTAVQLFSAEAEGRVQFAINPVVAQELLLSADATLQPGLGRLVDHLKVLPVDFAKVEKLVFEAARALNAMTEGTPLGTPSGQMAHPNELIILSSAEECDFLVTTDTRLKDLVEGRKPEVVTPRELVARLRAA